MNSIYFSAPSKLGTNDRYNSYERAQPFRGVFAKDRDRILYSKAFRRLSDKTQVFLSSSDRDIRTRLTHTLEVNQIAKTIASALSVNLELTEAIALGHDIGHTPFGHVGERTLNYIMNGCEPIDNISIDRENKGFKHNLQALRILCSLEAGSTGMGLNISKYTLWGIANHSKLSYRGCSHAEKYCKMHKHISCTHERPECSYYGQFLSGIENDRYWSVEGLIVAVADEIAQRHHDIEDSLRYNIIDKSLLLDQLNMFKDSFTPEDRKNFKMLQNFSSDNMDEFITLFSRLIVNFNVVAVIKHSKLNIKQMGETYGIKRRNDFIQIKPNIPIESAKKLVGLPETTQEIDNRFQEFLKTTVLSSYMAQSMDGKGEFIIKRLFKAYMSNPIQLPDQAISQFYHEISMDSYSTHGQKRANLLKHIDKNENKLMRVVTDHIGGMTDNFAYNQFDLLYGTRTDSNGR